MHRYRYDRLFIGGEWIASTGHHALEVVSPHDEKPFGRTVDGTTEDMEKAVLAARHAFDHGDWPQRTPAERARIVTRFTELYKERLAELAKVIVNEVGTPIWFSNQAQVHAPWLTLVNYLRVAAEYPWEERRKSVGYGGNDVEATVRRVPVGVVAAIVPWNVPQTAAMVKLAPALLAGCTVVLKPSPETAIDACLLAEIVEQAGFPKGVVNIVPAGPEVSEWLVRNPMVDKVAFTGSTAVGRRIGAICGEQIKRHNLELGGKSAAILLDDVKLDEALPILRHASFANNGQACVAQTRILASRSRYAEVVDALASLVSGLRVGDPNDPANQIGPMVSRRQQERVRGYMALGLAEGARLVVGGTGSPEGVFSGWYVKPTLFANVHNSMRIAQEEIFGPVLVVIPYDDEVDAVRIANDSNFGLAGSVWTADRERGIGIARQIRAGNMAVNTWRVDFAAPFGGFKQSGVGREFGPEGLEAYVEYQTLV